MSAKNADELTIALSKTFIHLSYGFAVNKKICQNVHTDDVCSIFVNLALLCIFQILYKDHKLFDSMSFVFVLDAG